MSVPGARARPRPFRRPAKWLTIDGNPDKHIKKSKARIFIWTNGAGVLVYRARVTVTYGVLK